MDYFTKGHYVGDSIEGTFNQGGTLPLGIKAIRKPLLNRPQTPREPFPYISEEVKIPNSDGSITLSGTLTLPDSVGVTLL